MKKTITSTFLAFLAVFAIVLCVPAPSVAAQIEGQISNGTTQRPVAHQKVDLISPRSGMAMVGGATTDASGHFAINDSRIDTSGFYLLQATYEGVDYNAPVKFNAGGNASANIKVYEATDQKPTLRISSARVIVRAEGSQAHIQELFALQNPLNKAYRNSKGTFFFHVPSKVESPTVAAVGLMNMPLPQNAEKGKSAGDFHITYPLKPGMNVMVVAYDTDYSANKLFLTDSVPYPVDRMQLFVIPSSLNVQSSLFTPAGQDAQSGAQVLEASGLKAGTVFTAQITGQPAPAAAQSGSDQGQGQEQAQGQEQVKVVPDSITSVGVPFLLCFLLVLLWALGIRVAKEWPRWKAKQAGSPVQKQFQAKMDSLINSIADIDELFTAGKIAEKQYWKERLELKAKAVAILKGGPSTKSKPYAAPGSHH
ncbi:MAG: hypothetical protein P8Z30_10155 [Acidobacteriota bacterium]